MIQDEIQNEAVDAWEAAGYVGTLNLGVGAGKTFCFFKSLYRLQDAGLLTNDDLVVFKALFNDGVDITKISFRGDIHKTLSTVFDDEFLCETVYFIPDKPNAKYPEYTHLKINLFTMSSL